MQLPYTTKYFTIFSFYLKSHLKADASQPLQLHPIIQAQWQTELHNVKTVYLFNVMQTSLRPNTFKQSEKVAFFKEVMGEEKGLAAEHYHIMKFKIL